MIIEKEYPATHSMSTSWFAIDLDGNVAILDFNENGPVPTVADSDSSEASVLMEVLAEKQDNLPYPILDFTKEEINEIISNSRPFNNEIGLMDTIAKIEKDKLNRFCEILQQSKNAYYHAVCLNKEEGIFYIDWLGGSTEEHRLIKELFKQHIIKPICHVLLLSDDLDEDDENVEECGLKGFPFYVYRQYYSPHIPIKRTQKPKSSFREDRLTERTRRKALRLPLRFEENESIQIAMYTPTVAYSNTRVIGGREHLDLNLADGRRAFIAQDTIFNLGCGETCFMCYYEEKRKLTSTRQFSTKPTVLIITDLNGMSYTEKVNLPILHHCVMFSIVEGVPCENTYDSFKSLRKYPIATYFSNCRCRLEKNVDFFKPRVIMVYQDILPYLSEVYEVTDNEITICGEKYPMYIWEERNDNMQAIEKLAQMEYRGNEIEWVKIVDNK